LNKNKNKKPDSASFENVTSKALVIAWKHTDSKVKDSVPALAGNSTLVIQPTGN
jgi:hypothetical protein